VRGIVGALAAFVAFFVGFTVGLLALGMYALGSSSELNMATLVFVGTLCGVICAWLARGLVHRLYGSIVGGTERERWAVRSRTDVRMDSHSGP
jgi:hypothetical protein